MPGQPITCLEAVRDAIAVEMRTNERIVLLGEGTGERGGSFGHTRGLWQEFGSKRLIDTPISELGFTGAGIGAAMTGLHPIVDMMFADFLAEAMSQIVNQAAKVNYLSNGGFSAPMVIRAPMGALRGGGAHHSGCLYPWFMHIPGLKVVTFSTAEDGYGLMRSALNDDGPVLFMDHKALFNTKDSTPPEDHIVPLGIARVLREGTEATVVACGLMARRAVEAADSLAGRVSVEVVDPRTLAPLDVDMIYASVEKTGRLLTVDEAYPACSLASEVSAAVTEHRFDSLDAPIRRLNSQPITHPIAPALEEAMIPQIADIEKAIVDLMQA